jgi:hypothetical protein
MLALKLFINILIVYSGDDLPPFRVTPSSASAVVMSGESPALRPGGDQEDTRSFE